MKLQVINSNSDGNAYLLRAEYSRETLLIDCGVHIARIKRALDFNLYGVSCLVTHSHGDHAKSLGSVLAAGIPVYASAATLAATGQANHHRAKCLEAGDTVLIGGFRVKAFGVNHDVPCLGFMIDHRESGLVLFLTDTYYCDYVFPGLNNILVECNHAMDIVRAGDRLKSVVDRTIQSHMNIETCKGLLAANDLGQVNNIVLIHLSDTNSDAARFQREISACTGKQVSIAEPGLCIPFNKTPI